MIDNAVSTLHQIDSITSGVYPYERPFLSPKND
jgi:hypothetical protein